MTTENIQYVYLIQEREFINCNKPIYKVGKTKQINNLRFCSYPKGSHLLSQLCCNDCDETERQIISLFDKKYKRCHKIGREYYEGEYRKMIIDIVEIINYKKEIEDLNELKYLIEIVEQKKEISSLTEKNNDVKMEISANLVELTDNKEPEIAFVEKINKIINKIIKKEYKFSCEKCCYSTDLKCDFETHKKSKTHIQKENGEFEENFCCKICNKKYKSNVGLWKHNKTCKMENLTIEIKDCKEPENTIVEKINKIIKKEYKFSCEKCCYYTDVKTCFDNHKKSKTHEKKEKNIFEENFCCKVCNKKYKSNVGLWKHNKTCKIEKKTNTEREKEKLSNIIKDLLSGKNV